MYVYDFKQYYSMSPTPSARRGIPRIALVLGPLGAVLCYALLPDTYGNATGQSVALSHTARHAGDDAVDGDVVDHRGPARAARTG